MATVRKQTVVDVPIAEVWDAARDFGALDTRLAAGYVTACRLEGEDRIVTLANGNTFRERLISIDDTARRLCWTIVDGPWTHHNGVLEVFSDEQGRTRLVWTTDALPHDTEEMLNDGMQHGIHAIQQTLEHR
jgi:hypothetical protein